MVEQPHFNDELTVLTAQQVVPLAKVRTRKRWFLGGAFAVAMLLGAASAIVSAYFKFRNMPDPEIQPASVSSVLSGSEPAPQVVQVSARRPKPRPRNTDQTDSLRIPDIQPQLSEGEALKQIRDTVLFDGWQERRERRVRRNAQHRDRNLSNIDEIFEGPHHP